MAAAWGNAELLRLLGGWERHRGGDLASQFHVLILGVPHKLP